MTATPLSEALTGIRVISLAINLPGPVAAWRLAALGAEVIKVEPPSVDPLATVAPGWYAELHEKVNVRSLDLKEANQRAVLDDLLTHADVLLTAQRPAALSRLRLDRLDVRFPRLVHLEIVGHHGERANEPEHDLTYQATEGTLAPQEGPTMPTVPVADLLGAERAATTILAALAARGPGGRGGRHRVALEDAAKLASSAVRHGMMGHGAPLGGALPTYNIYAAADGHVALAALEPHFGARVHEHIGTTAAELAAALAAHPTSYWEQLAARLDIPLAVIQSVPTRGAVAP